VLNDEELLTNKQFVESVKIASLSFDPEAMAHECRNLNPTRDPGLAKLGAEFIRQFRTPRPLDNSKNTTPSTIYASAGSD
jgi:hypothetical protein